MTKERPPKLAERMKITCRCGGFWIGHLVPHPVIRTPVDPCPKCGRKDTAFWRARI